MKRAVTFTFGLSLALIGAAKAVSHSSSDLAAALAASWCRTGQFEAGAGFWSTVQAHCWGCGVAPLGAAIMLYAARHDIIAAWRAVAGRNATIGLEQG